MHVCLTLSLYRNIYFGKELGFTSQSPSFKMKVISIVYHCCPTSWLLAALTDRYVWLTGFWKGREHVIHRVKSLPGDVNQCITVLWNGGLTCCCVLNSSSSCRDEFTVSQNKRKEISSRGYYDALRKKWDWDFPLIILNWKAIHSNSVLVLHKCTFQQTI